MPFSEKIGKVVLCGALLVACTGPADGSKGGGPGGAAGSGDSSGDSSSGSTAGTTASSSGGSASATGSPSSLLNLPSSPVPTRGMHKLTAWEFTNSVQDLLGSGVPLAPVEQDTLIGGFATVGATSVSISPAGVDQYETVLGAATAYAFADSAHASAVLACVPQATTDTVCLTQALNSFGRRAFRRPLSAAETTQFVNLATAIGNQSGSSVLNGIRHAVWAILQSPDFLYRVELGSPSSADGGRLKYTSFEIASRLAATLWASVPDDALLDAAAQDALSTADGDVLQAQRMLADPRAHRAIAAFVDQLFDAFSLSQADKDATLFPAFTPTLRAAMLQEIERRVDDVTFAQKADYFSLFESKSTFVNQELATFYGLPFSATDGSFQHVDLPADSPRVGLLGAAAVLAGHAHSQLTSPTLRGKFVNEMLLCRSIGAPPPGTPPLPSMAPAGSTVRQVLSLHRTAPLCASCHGLMDPIGFGMEAFDTTGQYRTTDNGQAIDTTGTLDGVAFSNLAELGSVVRKNAVVGPCFVSKVYENALGRLPVDLDGVALDKLIGQFVSGGNRVDQLLTALVGSDGFRFVAPK